MRSDKHKGRLFEGEKLFAERQAEIDAWRRKYESHHDEPEQEQQQEKPAKNSAGRESSAPAKERIASSLSKIDGLKGQDTFSGKEGLTPEIIAKAEKKQREPQDVSDDGNSSKEKKSGRKPKAKKTKTSQKPVTKKRVLITVLVCVAILLVSGVAGAYVVFHNVIGKINTVKTNYKDFDISSKVEKDLSDYQNIVILGVDARKHEKIKGSRSDAIVIASINKKTNDVKLTSVMRDSYLEIESQNDEKYLDKITHAHAFGGAIDTAKALNRNLDLNIQEFLVFNWKAVADMVDALGGVTVDIQANEISDLNYYGDESARNVDKTYKPIYNTGKQTLDGAQAVTYCRIRKNSGGDTGRSRRFKNVFSALIKKASKMNGSTIRKVTSDVLPEIQTNMNKRTMLSIMMSAGDYKLGKNYTWSEKYYGGILNGVWYSVPTTLKSNVEWLHQILFDQKDYKVTERVEKISQQIIDRTGIGAGAGNEDSTSTDDQTNSDGSQSYDGGGGNNGQGSSVNTY